MAQCRAGLEALSARLARGIARDVERKTGSLAEAKARVEALSPLAVLNRGYSITFHSDTGRVVRSSGEVELGTPLKIRLGRGNLEADVTGKE